MTKTLLIFFITVFVSGCSYEPIMTAKNYLHEDYIQDHLEEQQKFFKRFYSWEKKCM